jgi:endonuclease IV
MSFGPHVNRYHAGPQATITAHIEHARAEAATMGAQIGVAAIFVSGPRDRKIAITPEEARELREYIATARIAVYAHSSYSAVPWGGDPDAARFIREEVSVCRGAGVRGLVVHLPKQPVTAVMKYVSRLLASEQKNAAAATRIYFETPAVTPPETYYETPEKLAALFAAIRGSVDPELEHFGLCVDTAHLWTCGVDLRGYAAANAWLERLEAVASTIPPGCIMFHLNDSKRKRGTGPDAHAGLAAGQIWGDYAPGLRPIEESGLAAFADYARRNSTPLILERKPKELLQADYTTLKSLLPARGE